MQGATGGGLDMVVMPTWRKGDSAGTLGLTIEVAGKSVLPAGSDAELRELEVEIYAYVVDPSGSVVAHLARSATISLDDWGERLSSGGLRFDDQLVLPDGELSVRSLVLVPALGQFGMAVSELEPDPARGEPGRTALGRARFGDPCADWLLVAGAGSAPPSGLSARPVWRPGQVIEFRLPVAGDVSEPGSTLFAHLLSSAGASTRIPLSRADISGAGRDLLLRLSVPDLESGIYLFAVEAGADGSVTSPASEVWIVPGQAPADTRASETQTSAEAVSTSSCSWPALRARGQASLADIAPVRGRVSADSTPLRRRVRNEYVDILRDLGAGEQLDAAVERLVEWERDFVGDDLQRNMDSLRAAQLATVRALAETDQESLLPVFELHRVAYREHFRQRSFGLAGHSRTLATTVAEIRLASFDVGEDPGWVADALVSLAKTADRHRMFAASQGLLVRAAEAAPAHRAARLLLSMLYEKLGEYDAAVEHLEALVAVSPTDAEGWLRLGTLQHRLGRAEECRRSIHQVIGQRPSPWVLSLAYQTMIQQLFAEERFGDGLAALAEAEFLLPSDPELAMARAYGLDRVGRGREATATLMSLEPVAESVSSRLRYIDAGDSAAARVDRRLRRDLLLRQSVLAGAVAAAFGGPA